MAANPSRIHYLRYALETDLQTGLTANYFDPEFTVSSLYVPTPDLADLATPVLNLMPQTRQTSIETRQTTYDQISMALVVRCLVDQTNGSFTTSDVDELHGLMEQLSDYLQFKTYATVGYRYSWVGSDNSPIFDPDRLLKQREYLSVLNVNYRVVGTTYTTASHGSVVTIADPVPPSPP